MSPNHYIKQSLQNFTNVRDRANRSEFWWFQLFLTLMAILFVFFDIKLNLNFMLVYVYILIVAMPQITICVRRLHDFGRSGWWYLLVLSPYIGKLLPVENDYSGWFYILTMINYIATLFPLIIGLVPGNKDSNKYGEPPAQL